MSRCRPQLRRWYAGGAAALALAALINTGNTARAAQPAAAGAACDARPRPAKLNFTLKDIAGEKVSLSSFKGKVLLLDFWATWCIPCRTEIPGFVGLQQKYGDQGLQVIGVSVDDTVEKLRPYAAEMHMNYPVLVGRDHGDLLDAYGPLPSVPTSVLIGRDGRICTRHAGVASIDVFEREIRSLL